MSNLETTDIAAILAKRQAEAAEREANTPPPPKVEEITAFYRGRMLTHGYDDREPDCHHGIAKWCAKRFLGTEDRGLLLYGENGNGKTLGANEVAKFMGAKVLWAPNIVSYWLNDEETPWLEKVMGFCATGKYWGIIIDELGKDLETGRTEIVNGKARPEIALPTKFGHKFNPLGNLLGVCYDKWRNEGFWAVITTNLDGDGIERYYGKHIRDRFNEMFRRVAFVGQSRREEWKKEAAF